MSRRRSIKFLSAFAAASLIVAACSGDDDDDAITEGTTEETSAGTEPEGTTAGTEAETTEPESSEPETTEGETEAPRRCARTSASRAAAAAASRTARTRRRRGAGRRGPRGLEPGALLVQQPHQPRQRRRQQQPAVPDARPAGFSYYDEDLNYINNDQFGTCTIDSLDPLTITYTINEGVTWSDGTPVDAADMLLAWAAQSGVFNDADTVVTEDTGVTAQADENGSPIIVGPDGADITSVDEAAYAAAFDPETGALLEGYTYKESTGVSFDSASESLQLITQFPEISEDGRSLTATWDSFYVDYQTAGVFPGVPAHVVGQNALGIEDPMEAKTALIDALQRRFDDPPTPPTSRPSPSRGTGTSTPRRCRTNPGVYAGFGPYNLVDFTEDGTMTFEAREDYTWGPQPHVQTIVYSIIGDPTAAVQAMENEEIDIIQPQATADILTQLDAIADRGVEVIQDDGATYEHIDLAQNNGGPFDPATYGGDAATALAVRQAFLHAVPAAGHRRPSDHPAQPERHRSQRPGRRAGGAVLRRAGRQQRLRRVRRDGHRAGAADPRRRRRRHRDADRRAVAVRQRQPAPRGRSTS